MSQGRAKTPAQLQKEQEKASEEAKWRTEWKPQEFQPPSLNIHEPELQNFTQRLRQKIKTPADLFKLFLTETAVRDIVKKTNEKGENIAAGKSKRREE